MIKVPFPLCLCALAIRAGQKMSAGHVLLQFQNLVTSVHSFCKYSYVIYNYIIVSAAAFEVNPPNITGVEVH